MGLSDQTEDAVKPPPRVKSTKFQHFSEVLLLVVPHDDTLVSMYPNDDGSPKEQTFTTIIPLEDGYVRLEGGKKLEWKAGDVHKSYIEGALRKQLRKLDTPILGRLGKGKPGPKGGRPWELATPTEEDRKLLDELDSTLGLEEKFNKAVEEAAEYKANRAQRSAAAPAATVEEEEDDEAEVPWKA